MIHLLKHAEYGNGHVHVAVDLACAQVGLGDEVWFASAGGPYDSLLAEVGVHVVRIPEPHSPWSAIEGFVRVWSLVRCIRPDILHAHMMSSAVIGRAVAALTRTVLVTTMHNSFDRHSSLMRLGRVVVAVSDAERRQLVERGIPAARVAAVLNGPLGTPRDRVPERRSLSVRSPAITTLSGLHARKGLSDVIQAFALFHVDFPLWHLNVIGSGPDKSALQRLAEDLAIGGHVHFLGSTPTPKALLRDSLIFVSGALAEPFGLNLVEAREAGCAVIGTRVGGIPEVLEQGEAGILVPPAAPEALAVALRRLAGNESELEHWRLSALNDLEKFSAVRMARDYGRIYRRLVRDGARDGSCAT